MRSSHRNLRDVGWSLEATRNEGLGPNSICSAPNLRRGTFASSFAIVAYYWLDHRMIFASLRGVKVALTWTNMLFLFTIAVLPFSTAMLGRYSLAPVALAIYRDNLFACTSTLAGA